MIENIHLELDTSGGDLALVVYEVYWDDEADGLLFTQEEKAQFCARMERTNAQGQPIQGKVRTRYVFP